MIDAAEAAASGGWDRRAMLAFQAWALRNALGDPATLVRRLRFRVTARRRCPVVKVPLDEGRIIPEDRHAWLHEVAQDHEVV